MINFNSRYHQCFYTPEHRIPTITSKNNIKVFKAGEIGDNFNIPNSGFYCDGKRLYPAMRIIARIYTCNIGGNSTIETCIGTIGNYQINFIFFYKFY